MGFDEVLKEYGAAMARVAESYTSPGQDREDLEQDIALAVWRALPRHRGESSLKTYILRIAHNRGLAYAWRRKQRRAAEEVGAAEVADQRPGPERQAMARQRRQALAEVIRSLPLNLRQPMALALEGLAYAEIGEVLGISENNVAVRVHRARAAIREAMEERS